MRNIPYLLIGFVLAGSTVFSSVLVGSVPELETLSSQNAIFVTANLAGETPEFSAATPAKRSLVTFRNLTNKKKTERKTFYGPQVKAQVALAPVKPVKKEPTLLAVVDQPEIKMEHRKIADEVIRNMPSECQNVLKDFYVRYDSPEHRGLAGKSVMILDGTVPNDEFRALFVHEFGHVSDLGCLDGTSDSGKSGFTDGNSPIYKDDPSVSFYQISWITSETQRSNVKQEDFVSGYASYDAFEDFAESFAYYVLHYETFAARAKTNSALAAKLQWLEAHFPTLKGIATGKSSWAGKVPWDITKLPYVWHPTTLLTQS